MYEVRRRWPGGAVAAVPVADLSDRDPWSEEINTLDGEAGGLNANYRQFEAGMILANRIGLVAGLTYGEDKDFILKTVGDVLCLEFATPALYRQAAAAVPELVGVLAKEAA